MIIVGRRRQTAHDASHYPTRGWSARRPVSVPWRYWHRTKARVATGTLKRLQLLTSVSPEWASTPHKHDARLNKFNPAFSVRGPNISELMTGWATVIPQMHD